MEKKVDMIVISTAASLFLGISELKKSCNSHVVYFLFLLGREGTALVGIVSMTLPLSSFLLLLVGVMGGGCIGISLGSVIRLDPATLEKGMVDGLNPG